MALKVTNLLSTAFGIEGGPMLKQGESTVLNEVSTELRGELRRLENKGAIRVDVVDVTPTPLQPKAAKTDKSA